MIVKEVFEKVGVKCFDEVVDIWISCWMDDKLNEFFC